MDLPRVQHVSEILHRIADLVQEADAYLCESDCAAFYFPDIGKKGKKKPKGGTAPLRKGGMEPNKVDAPTNRARVVDARVNPPRRDLFRAERERKQRDRYAKYKLVTDVPIKTLGSRVRDR